MSTKLPQICYAGTYERGYPRNYLVIQALRDAGAIVEELHVPVIERVRDKSAASAFGIFVLTVRLVLAYLKLIPALILRLRGKDALAVGYIGQLDMLVLAPVARAMRKTVIFNPLVTLTDTLVEDRRRFSPTSMVARMISFVDRLSLGLASVVIADTEQNADYLRIRFSVPPRKIVIVPVGADEAVFFPDTNRTASTCGCANVDALFIGKFIPLHGIDTIIRSAKILQERAVPVQVEMVGTGQTYAEMRSLATAIGVRNITWTDWIPYEELGDRLRRADIALGVFDEGGKGSRVVPNKVYQSLACGIATITRTNPPTEAMLTSGTDAVLVPPADPVALADAIAALTDLGTRLRVGATGYRAYERAASRNALSRQIAPVLEMVRDR